MSYIQVAQHQARPLRWWFEQFLAGNLDMDPPYQRRSDIWTDQKKAHLIDSLINDFDVPKFYVADFSRARSPLNVQKKPYAIVDGKQRFGAIFDFMQGKIQLNRSSRWLENPQEEIKGLDFSGLRERFPALASKIEFFEPVVMSIATDDDAKIYEMFVRLNSGEAANSAERRNARPGPIPGIVRQLTAHPFFSNRVRFNRRRMQEFNLAAKLLLIESNEALVDTKAKNLDRLVEHAAVAVQDADSKSLDGVLLNYQELQDRVLQNLELLADAFEESDVLLSKAGNIPVYYWIVRQHPEVVDNLRDFMARFDAKLQASVKAGSSGGRADPELAQYYTFARSTNDQASLRGRYHILAKLLRADKLIN
ncbi:DUF262 domain-containing protein [Stenotrophomonas sp. NPDC101269]|uniref:DUF262 domain-containing protein n=1 Tax=Stenotrophomonas TaxID=40323 RepID=UPI0012926816|nr:DUF262 domain-containing protein [Stenotrophomonas nematodicola]